MIFGMLAISLSLANGNHYLWLICSVFLNATLLNTAIILALSRKYRVIADRSVSVVDGYIPEISTDQMQGIRKNQILLSILIARLEVLWRDWIEIANRIGFPVEFSPKPIKK